MFDFFDRLFGFIQHTSQADLGTQIPVLIFVGILYLVGYVSVRMLLSKVWWQWLLLIFVFFNVLLPMFTSGNAILITGTSLGMAHAYLKNRHGFFLTEWVYDFRYWLSNRLQQRRSKTDADARQQEAEEAFRRSQEYEARAKASYEKQEAERKAHEAWMHQEKERQKREKPKARQSASNESTAHLNPNILADAYEILGVRQGASLAECKKARMTLLAMYHPDKVAHLNETRQKMAEEETKRINAAWERVKR